jgi:uncharacterized protein (TIGR02421 family)
MTPRYASAYILEKRFHLAVWTTYKEKIKDLSEKIVEAQRPIKILNSIKWDEQIEDKFFAAKGKELPEVDADYYKKISLDFDPIKKRDELNHLLIEIRRELGDQDDLGKLLSDMVDQYRSVVDMLEARGTKKFYECSRRLYGSPKDSFFDDKLTVLEEGRLLYSILSNLEGKELGREYPKNIEAETVVKELQLRFEKSFLKRYVAVRLDDGIIADSAAGGDILKIKQGALFSKKDIDIFEVHEGWVHIATSINGKNQKVAKWLAKGPPRCVSTQEGLAVLMEIFTFSSYPRRARAINDRILGIDKAEEGADFLQVFEFYQTEGYDESDAFRNAMRVFRGGDVKGGAPFTKDISYCKGFVENYNFIRAAIRRGHPELIPFMYAGKLHVDDVPLLYQKYLEGVIDAPALLPPQFADLTGLAVWMAFSNFLTQMNLKKVQGHFDELFSKYL